MTLQEKWVAKLTSVDDLERQLQEGLATMRQEQASRYHGYTLRVVTAVIWSGTSNASVIRQFQLLHE